MNDARTNRRRSAASIDVAVFDRSSLVSTHSCRGLSEARAVMNRSNAEGHRCLIVSPTLSQTLDGSPREWA